MKTPVKGRCCKICGKIGGMGSTTILRLLGYDIPKGEIGYAHSKCFQKKRATLARNNNYKLNNNT